jgi:hypothetical protein
MNGDILKGEIGIEETNRKQMNKKSKGKRVNSKSK